MGWDQSMNPGISGYGAQKGVMSEINAAAAEHEHQEDQGDLDAQELVELEQAEYYGAAPTPRPEAAPRRTLLDRLLRRPR